MLMLLTACVLSKLPDPVTETPAPAPSDIEALKAAPAGPVELESVVSARWAWKSEGLVDLDDPKSIAAGLHKGEIDIVLSVHVLKHPDAGVYMVDTGISRELAAGRPGPARGLAKRFLKSMKAGEPLGDIVARQTQPLAGVFVTHTHVDHILGLTDLDAGTPVWLGPRELRRKSPENGLLRRTMNNVLPGDLSYQTWPFAEQGVPLGPVERAVDVVGDGSIWALHVPGHTVGSTAFLVNSTNGWVLLLGDVAHTHWAWNNEVPSGESNDDQDGAVASFRVLQGLARTLDAKVYVGHETDGVGTGVDEAFALSPDPVPH